MRKFVHEVHTPQIRPMAHQRRHKRVSNAFLRATIATSPAGQAQRPGQSAPTDTRLAKSPATSSDLPTCAVPTISEILPIAKWSRFCLKTHWVLRRVGNAPDARRRDEATQPKESLRSENVSGEPVLSIAIPPDSGVTNVCTLL